MKLIASLTFDDIHPYAIDIQKLRNIFDLLDEYSIKSTIFISPICKGKSIRDDKDYVNLINNYLINGNEIGVHGFQHKLHEFGYYFLNLPYPSLEIQIDRLSKSIRLLEETFHTKIYGFRAPNYEFNSNTIEAIRRLQLNYDSSKTVFKPSHIPWHGIRFKTFTDPYPSIINGITEIPITGDYTFEKKLKDFGRCLEALYKDIEFVHKKKGILVINNHINFTSIDYEKFLNALLDINELEFHTMADISSRDISSRKITEF